MIALLSHEVSLSIEEYLLVFLDAFEFRLHFFYPFLDVNDLMFFHLHALDMLSDVVPLLDHGLSQFLMQGLLVIGKHLGQNLNHIFDLLVFTFVVLYD